MNEVSPLTEADAGSIQELFNKNPEELSDSEIDKMVVELRKQRTTWLVSDAAKAAKGKEAKGVPLDKATMDDLLKDL